MKWTVLIVAFVSCTVLVTAKPGASLNSALVEDALSSTTTRKPGTNPPGAPDCSPDHHGAYYAHELYCEQYFQCDNYDAILFYCRDVLLFDLTYMGCNFPDKVDCGDRKRPNNGTNPITTTTTKKPATGEPVTDDTPGYDCDPNNNGAFEHPVYCEKYYDCYEGVDTLMNCNDDWLFEPKWSGCEKPELVDCGNRIRPNGTNPTTTTTTTKKPVTGEPVTEDPPEYDCDPNNNGAFPHPIYCEKYYDCYEGVDTLMKCSDDWLFEPKWSGCEKPELVDCGNRIRPNGTNPTTPTTTTTTTKPVPTGEPGFICPSPEGNFADPKDCSLYYACSNNTPYPAKCPPPLLFDDKNQICDYADNVDCKDRPKP